MKKLNDPIDPDAYCPQEAQRESTHLRTLYPEWAHLARLQPQGELDPNGELGAVRKIGGILIKDTPTDDEYLSMAESALQVVYDQGPTGWENIRVIFRGNLTDPAMVVAAPDLASAFYFIEGVPAHQMRALLNEFVREVVVCAPVADSDTPTMEFALAPQEGKGSFEFPLTEDFQKAAGEHFAKTGKTPKPPVVLRDVATLN